MNKKDDNIIFIFGMCPLIPISSNFAYGMIIAISIWIVFFSGILGNILVEMINIKKGKKSFVNILVISLTTAFSFLIQGIFPIIHGTIQMYIYILSFSYIIFLSLEDYYTNIESLEFPATYSILILIISAIRELLAFGTISLPATKGFFSIPILGFLKQPPLRFFGTTAGAFIILGISLWLYISIKKGNLIPFKEGEK